MNIAVINDIIKNNPILDHPTQLELVSDWQKNKVKPSLDKLVLSNMRIVSREAFLLKRRNGFLSYEDLVQEGVAGVLKAADMFDSSRNVNFLTYAMLWVKANMRSHVLSYRSVVKMGTTRDDRVLFSNLSKVMSEAEEAGLTGDDKLEFIAKKLSVNKKSIQQMMVSVKGYDTRLDAPIKSSDGSETLRIDLMEDDDSGEQSAIDAIGGMDSKSILRTIIDSIPDSESKILRERFLTDSPKTLRDLEAEMGISREWIRKLEMRGLERVKKRLSKEYGITDILDI